MSIDIEKVRKYEAGLIKAVIIAAENSNGRLCVKTDVESKHYLELDGKKISCYIEEYVSLADHLGWQQVLATFFQDIFCPLTIKRELPQSFTKGGEILYLLGKEIYPEKYHNIWREILGLQEI